MKKVFIILTGVLIFTTVVCGIWMYSQEAVEESSKQFHMISAFSTVLSSIITMYLLNRK